MHPVALARRGVALTIFCVADRDVLAASHAYERTARKDGLKTYKKGVIDKRNHSRRKAHNPRWHDPHNR